jgi:thiamine pyrophosphate-dependent acetolactate synthase large subunit-like protein
MERYGAGLMTGDYAKVAEGLGATGITIEHPEEIGPAIKRAQRLNEEGRCVLLDVKTQEENKMSIYRDT